jgi:hypothetical protein
MSDVHGSGSRMERLPPGGLTPVFNEITILLAISPDRPVPDATLDTLDCPAEKLVMRNVIDKDTGIVQPTIFHRSETFVDANTGVRTQILALAADLVNAPSKLLGGELSVHVRPPMETPAAAAAGFPAASVANLHMPHFAPVPAQASVGKIEALSPAQDFPARVVIPVYYSFVVTGHTGPWAASRMTSRSVVAKEPHIMKAVVNSVPPDPEVCVHADEWGLVEESGLLSLWIKVECFRFLGMGDWEHKERLSYKGRQTYRPN